MDLTLEPDVTPVGPSPGTPNLDPYICKVTGREGKGPCKGFVKPRPSSLPQRPPPTVAVSASLGMERGAARASSEGQ